MHGTCLFVEIFDPEFVSIQFTVPHSFVFNNTRGCGGLRWLAYRRGHCAANDKQKELYSGDRVNRHRKGTAKYDGCSEMKRGQLIQSLCHDVLDLGCDVNFTKSY